MSETLQNVKNTEIKSIVEQLKELDKEFDSNSSELSSKLVSLEKEIENIKKDEKTYQKYRYVINDLESMLSDLLEDGEINEKDYSNKAYENIDYINIPKGHIVSYEGEINGERFIISEPEKDGSYSDFKLFIENGLNQKEVKINNVTRYRDGGTTYVKTDIGTLYFPTILRNAKPTFTNLKGDVIIMETGEKIDILGELQKISSTDLFEKNKDAYDLMYENFYNETTMTDKALSLFKNKISEYATENGYTLEKGFKVWSENEKFTIDEKFIEKSPEGTPENAGRLELFFGD